MLPGADRPRRASSRTAASPGTTSRAAGSRRRAATPSAGATRSRCAGRSSTGIARARSRARDEAARPPQWGRPSVHASTIRRRPDLSHAIPLECADRRRALPDAGRDRCAESEAEMRRSCSRARAADDPDFDGRLAHGRRARARSLLDRDEPVVRESLIAAVEADARPRDRSCAATTAGWTRASSSRRACPASCFGPTGAGVHTADEWVDLASVDACADIYERLARSFCG